MADISNELITISDDIYGKNVKEAIHDGLRKVNEDQSGFDARISDLEEQVKALSGEGLGITVWAGTKTEYDTIDPHDPNTLYCIKDPSIEEAENYRKEAIAKNG